MDLGVRVPVTKGLEEEKKGLAVAKGIKRPSSPM